LPCPSPDLNGGAHTRCRGLGRAQLGDLGPGEAAMKYLFAACPDVYLFMLQGDQP
jgi:hypothetical protein